MRAATKYRDAAVLAASLAACQAAGLIGALFTRPAIPGWYASLAKPRFTPPPWLFAPAWIALYLMMGVSLFLVWRRGESEPGRRDALSVFFLQLALNALWSPAFFGLRSTGAGMAVIAGLWVAIAVTLNRFRKVSSTAAWLLLPYFAWVSFAAALNYSLWTLNP
ncbi:MAG: TspO/MBR family protein [Chlamydiota bacterium]